MLSRFIDQLSKELGWVDPVEKKENGSYSLLFEPNLHISLQELDSTIMYFASIAPIPKENRAAFLHKMMCANLLGKETGGGALGIDKEEKGIVFVHFQNDQSSYKEFKETLEEFVNYADVWSSEANTFPSQQGDKG